MTLLILFGLGAISTFWIGWKLHKAVYVGKQANMLQRQLDEARKSHEKGNANRARSDSDITERLRRKGILRD
jgi:hypothetical protein